MAKTATQTKGQIRTRLDPDKTSKLPTPDFPSKDGQPSGLPSAHPRPWPFGLAKQVSAFVTASQHAAQVPEQTARRGTSVCTGLLSGRQPMLWEELPEVQLDKWKKTKPRT